MQEYFASILGLEVGDYYHIANNIHYYDIRHRELVEKLASIDQFSDDSYCYDKKFHSLEKFDILLKDLGAWEQNLRTHQTDEVKDFRDDFFNDWAKVLFQKVKKQPVKFINPILNDLIITS